MGRLLLTASIAAIWLVSAGQGQAQSFRRAGTEFDAVRSVNVPAGKTYSIIVAEFFHHGEIRPDGCNIAVVAQNKELVSWRVLQLGPGDVCRLAFQTIEGRSQYDIFYGGEPPRDEKPEWTCNDGLLLETRQFRHCDFHSLDSVRKAFDASTPIGADYVDQVFHGCNPFNLKTGPFLSRYTGYLDMPKAETYGLITSSQDCSFLLVDGKTVASAPGYHGPMYRVRPGSRHDLQLSAGQHKFEYYHAAAGSNAVMVAAWEVNPSDQHAHNPKPIPGEAFRSYMVGHLPAGRVTLRTAKLVPDFTMTISGYMPLPDNDVPLVAVSFRDASPKGLTMQGARIRWDFGDGQTATTLSADHVYLRPGLYPVKLSIRRGSKAVEIINRVYVDRPLLPSREKQPSFDEYVRTIDSYDAKSLDAASIRQLVLALEAKADTFVDGGDAAKHYLARAVEIGKLGFQQSSATKATEELLKLAQLVGPMARVRLGDSQSAWDNWRLATEQVAAPVAKAECEINAADIAVNDLAKPAAAKPLLEAATRRLGTGRSGPVAAMLQRVWGDYHAATGDGKAARAAYLDADRLSPDPHNFVQQAARLGAHARSTEEFLKEKHFDRAAAEIQAWQQELPSARLDGYLTLLYARYWAGRGQHAEAIAQAEQLQAANPDSPYVDQLLLLAADSAMRLGHKDRALATLHSLVKDYPGSPLVPLAKKNINILESRSGD
jgi:tetratricopeptide (TPR) repeat protein